MLQKTTLKITRAAYIEIIIFAAPQNIDIPKLHILIIARKAMNQSKYT